MDSVNQCSEFLNYMSKSAMAVISKTTTWKSKLMVEYGSSGEMGAIKLATDGTNDLIVEKYWDSIHEISQPH